MECTAQCNCGHAVVVYIVGGENGSYADCSQCGRNFWIEAPKTRNQTIHSSMVRAVAILIPLTGFIISSRRWLQQNETHGNSATGVVFWSSLMAFVLFSIPGIYVAVKGPLVGEQAVANRKAGLRRIVVGSALLIAAVVVNYGLMLFSSSLGFFWIIWTGGLGIGAVTFALGAFEVFCGRNLVEELGSIEFGKS